jgi:hypothetical protein
MMRIGYLITKNKFSNVSSDTRPGRLRLLARLDG